MSKVIDFQEARRKADKHDGFAGEMEHADLLVDLFDGDGDGHYGWDLALLCNKFTVLHLVGVRYPNGQELRIAFVLIHKLNQESNTPGLIGVFQEQDGIFHTTWSHRWWCDEFIEYTDPDLTTKDGLVEYFRAHRESLGVDCEIYT